MSWMTFLVVFGIAMAVFLTVMIGMAVGYIVSRKRLAGSCGGIASRTDGDGTSHCSLCSNSSTTCDERTRRIDSTNQGSDKERC